jgi:hypothetical protein
MIVTGLGMGGICGNVSVRMLLDDTGGECTGLTAPPMSMLDPPLTRAALFSGGGRS